MTIRRNQLHGIPTLPSGGHYRFKRSSFLGGGFHVYFGPGQHPGVTSSYEPPTDWPAVGTLLRMPQVVNLSALQAQLGSWSGPDPAYTFNTVYVLFEGATRTAFFAEATNAGYAEQLRMEAVFDEVKTRIEAIRPNRTWVISARYATIDAEAGTLDWNYVLHGNLVVMAPPVLVPARYLGTDFLHVYVGHLYDGDSHDATQFDLASDTSTPVDLADDVEYQDARGRLVGTFDNFRRHATRLYSATGLNWTDYTEAGGDSIATYTDGGWVVDGDYLTFIAGQSDLRMQQIAEDLAEHGVTYEGDGTGLDADAIVNLIAAHYGFDPSTGADLG